MDKKKVGRPKLADKTLKKKSLIISGICLIIILILIVTGVKILNIRPNKLKGESAEYKTYEVGEEFCLDTECFYVIEDNGDSLTALAKYNLLVGNIYNSETEELTEIPTSTEGYGLQNVEAKANDGTGTNWVGVIEFTIEKDNYTGNGYWYEQGVHDRPKIEYGSEYPAWVFDSNSNLWNSVQRYQKYLQNIGYSTVISTIPSFSMLENLGYNFEECTCDNSISWICASSYWLGTAKNSYGIYIVFPNSDYDESVYDQEYGLRPVITISKDDLLEKEEPTTSETSINEKTRKEEIVSTTTIKKNETTTITKKSSKKKNNKVIITTTNKITTDEEESKIINKLVSKTTTNETKEDNKDIKWCVIVPTIIVLLSCIGFIVYKKQK